MTVNKLAVSHLVFLNDWSVFLDKDIINFASDNTSGVDLEIFSVVEQAAKSSAMPYGDDVFTSKLQIIANEIFEKPVSIFPVATGSAANALALSVICPPYGSVYCHRESHLEEDECAAPEFYIGGGKLSYYPERQNFRRKI